MANMATTNLPSPATADTLISIRAHCGSMTRKCKLPLGDLTAQLLPEKISTLLDIPEGMPVIFERYSDSAAAYVTLDPGNAAVYKTLHRAAKAKLKLRLRVTVPMPTNPPPYYQPAPPGSFAAAHPELYPTSPQTTVNNTEFQPLIRASTIDELLPVANVKVPAEATQEQTEASATQSTPQSAPPKRMSSRLSREGFFAELANISRQRELALRIKEQTPASSWSVFCNACDKPMVNEHFHCNICDDGDYDLCASCVQSGNHCPGEGHWLVKRFVQNGQVVSSSTERMPKPPTKQAHETSLLEMPGAFTAEHNEEKELEFVVEAEEAATRTCNSCILEYPENKFVTCIECTDFDLCFPCHEANKHGHHPGHKFMAVVGETVLTKRAKLLCAPGRNAKHAAICDGCDKSIVGIRNKCLDCPDWDYCSECIQNAPHIHPGHRFAALFEQIAAPRHHKTRHVGIYCDGPLCENKHDYIEGVRYKCAICHDTDFCASCEAYPHNKHNHTHPLIQFKTAIRNATITTIHEDQFGKALAPKGDRPAKNVVSKSPTNAATQVQTIVDVKPAEEAPPPYRPSKERIEIKDLLAEPISEKIKIQDLLSSPIEDPKHVGAVDVSNLKAIFIRETVLDGTPMSPEQGFSQVWTLRNPGPEAWPAGCSVRYTGGDNMLNVDFKRPTSIGDYNGATTSNVIDRAIQAGEEVAFGVSLKAPRNVGTKISYWRLKTVDGQAFGHRLWCHIVVNPTAINSMLTSASQPVPQPSSTNDLAPQGSWQDNLLQQTLKQRRERAHMLTMQRSEHQRFTAHREVQAVAEAKAKADRSEMLQKLSTEIRAVETQHKARIAAAKAAVDAARAAQEASCQAASELPALPLTMQIPQPANMNPQAVMLEQQSKQRLQMARDQHEAVRAADAANAFSMPTPPRTFALQEFQRQLMLLEQQNKKRLLASRPEQSSGSTPAENCSEANVVDIKHPSAAAANYHEQLKLLEEQNKKRFTHRVTPAVGPTPSMVVPVEVEAPSVIKDNSIVSKVKPADAERSHMIFPTLDKESPSSSAYDVGSVATAKKAESPPSDKSDLEIFEDAESVSFNDSSDEDNGFLTDEEYDILDASDEEVARH